MSEVIKRYTFFAYLDDDVAELDCHEEEDGAYVLASDYDRDTKALEDKARNQHARDSVELRDLCSQRDGFKAELWRAKEERDSQQRIAIAAMTELSELKHVMAESLDNYRSMLHASEAQVAELKAKMEGMVLPADWVAVRMGFDGPDYPEDYAYGPPIMMNRLKMILEKYYAMRFSAAPRKDYESQ